MEENSNLIDNDDTKMISRIIMQEDITVSTEYQMCHLSGEQRHRTCAEGALLYRHVSKIWEGGNTWCWVSSVDCVLPLW